LTINAAAATLDSISINGPSSVNEGATATYTATASWSDGTTTSVTPTWGIVSGPATINASGALTAGSVTADQAATVGASYGSGGVTRTASKSVTVVDVPAATGIDVMPQDGAGDVPVNTVITTTAGGAEDIRTIFNKDTFTLKSDTEVEDSSMGPVGPLAAGVCIRDGVVQGSFEYDTTNTKAVFTPNCTLKNGTMYLASIASTGTGALASALDWQFTTIAGSPDSDGDGVPDNEDAFPNNKNKATPPSPKGHGSIEVDTSENSGTSLAEVMGISESNSRLNQGGRPADHEFRDGLVSFKVEGVAPGGTVAVKVAYVSDIPAGSKVYKVDANGFHEHAGASINGNILTLTLTDGGQGDSDGQANGVIVDPIGVAVPVSTGSGSIDLSTNSPSGSGGCSMAGRSGSGGGLRELAGAYGLLVISAVWFAVRGRLKRRGRQKTNSIA
jgi:hypothetical protein